MHYDIVLLPKKVINYVTLLFMESNALLTDSSSVPVLREIGCKCRDLQPEAYSFHFWCKRAFTVVKNITGVFLSLKTNKQAQPRWQNVMQK